MLNRIRKEERNARTSRMCRHGAILEGVFPAAIKADEETRKYIPLQTDEVFERLSI